MLRRNHDGCGLYDARLGGCNLLDGVAQAFGVIEVDWGEHRNIAVGNVRGIPFSAHANFKNQNIYRGIGKNCKTQNG